MDKHTLELIGKTLLAQQAHAERIAELVASNQVLERHARDQTLMAGVLQCLVMQVLRRLPGGVDEASRCLAEARASLRHLDIQSAAPAPGADNLADMDAYIANLERSLRD